MKTLCKYLRPFVIIGLLGVTCLHSDLSAGTRKRILLLHSYHNGYLWTDEISRGVRSVLTEDYELYVEYMDSKRLFDEQLINQMKSMLERKHSFYHYDAVITADNNAFNLVKEYKSEIFGDIPHVFCGVNYLSRSDEADLRNAAGVNERADIRGNLDLIQEVHPKCRTVHIVVDDTTTGKVIQQEVKRIEGYNVSINLIAGFSFAELGRRLSGIHEPDVVLMTVVSRDRDGVFMEYNEYTRFVTENSVVPVYACWGFNMGYGVLGGYLANGYDQGRTAAGKLLAVLSGVPVESVPVLYQTPVRLVFDYSIMKRFNLKKKDLPASALVVNKPDSFYQQYKMLIWQTLGIIMFLVLSLIFVSFGLIKTRRAKRDVQNKEKDLSTTLNSIGDAVISTDLSGHIIRMNPVAQQLTGWTLAEARGKELHGIFNIVNSDSGQQAVNPVDLVLQSDEKITISSERKLISRSGFEYLISDSAAPIRNAEGVTTGVVLVFRDITQAHAMEEQLRQSHKMDAVGQLAGGIAHDFNNMLAGIMGSTEILRMYAPLTDETDKYISLIMSSANRAADLAGKLLSFSRKQNVELSPVDLHKIVRNTASIMQNTIDRRISIRLQLESQASTVLGDETQLQNAIMNLGINAAQAMGGGGELSLVSRNVELGREYCELSRFNISPGSYIQLQVCDTGVGIAPENLERIFEPFFSTKEQGKGTGLGLSTVYGIVQMHDGAINVYSSAGEGSCFSILLPLTEESSALIENSVEPVKGSGLILLADDEKVIRYTGKVILNKLGYEVLTADNGREAVDVYVKNRELIDLVILDMIMPEMNGHDCFFELKRINPEVRVLLSSGFSKEQDLQDLIDNGLNGLIKKPYHTYEISRKIADVLG